MKKRYSINKTSKTIKDNIKDTELNIREIEQTMNQLYEENKELISKVKILEYKGGKK